MRMKALAMIPALHRATHRVGLYLQARVPGVTQAEAHLLAHLHESGGEATVADLHRAWAHKRSTLTDILDRLEARGLARRGVLPADRRSVLVRLTAKGRRSAAAVHLELAVLESEVLARTGRGALTGFGELVGSIESTAAATVSAVSPARRRGRGERK
jgi:DNA-binding MarR family transcriptional regulator